MWSTTIFSLLQTGDPLDVQLRHLDQGNGQVQRVGIRGGLYVCVKRFPVVLPNDQFPLVARFVLTRFLRELFYDARDRLLGFVGVRADARKKSLSRRRIGKQILVVGDESVYRVDETIKGRRLVDQTVLSALHSSPTSGGRFVSVAPGATCDPQFVQKAMDRILPYRQRGRIK